MLKKIISIISLGAFILISSCAVEINSPDLVTTVEVENDLYDLSVDVGGITTDVEGIDLEDLFIGDVSYSLVSYGTISSEKVTYMTGEVDVDIGSAVVYTAVLNQIVSISFSNISTMSTTISRDKTNTVVFDHNTAGTIFQALAKKRS